MKTKDFHKLLSDPSLVNASHVEELKTLVKLYPYFQAAHILLAKAAKLADDEHFDLILRKTALHSGDRKALFDLLMAEEIRRVVVQVDDEVDALVQSETIAEVAPKELTSTLPEPLLAAEVAEPVIPAPIPEIPDHTIGISAQSVVETLVEEQERLTSEPTETLTAVPPVQTESPPYIEEEADPDEQALKELDREILFKAVYSTIEKEIQEDITEQIAEKASIPSDSVPFKSLKTRHETEVEASDEEDFATIPPAHSAFTAWLMQRAEETHFIAIKKAEGHQQEIIEDRKVKEKHLIDDFIKKDPRIAQARLDQVSTENLGRSSIQESEALITETLAKVYVKQGKIDKAKKAYQLLSLKYPEKSIYFANQLKKLDEQT